MSGAVEIARFRVDPESEDRLVEAWPAMVDAMRAAHPDLQSVHLVRFDDGTWADVALWSTRDALDQVCGVDALPAVSEFLGHIAEDVSMDITSVVRTR